MQFQILRRLAYGGMAEVLLGMVNGSGKSLWVIKRILPHLRSQSDCLAMFAAEGRIGLRLQHQNIVRTYATIPEPKAGPAIVLEYIAGSTLAELLDAQARQGSRLPLAEVATVGRDIAQALAYVHGEGRAGESIVHRDVTPSNIMVAEGGHVKLIDFGVAKPKDRIDTLWPGCIKGKVAYMSPQQALGEPVDARTDQYALALVLWECLAGEPCFVRGNHFQTLTQVVHGHTRDLCVFRPDLPKSFLQALKRALELDPADRFDTMSQFAESLREFVGDAVANRRTLAQRRANTRRAQLAPGRDGAAITRPLALSLPGRAAQR